MLKYILLLSLFLSCAHRNILTNKISGYSYKSGEFVHHFKDTQGTVLIFISAYCPCSNSHIPLIRQLKNEFPQFKFIGVHSNANENKANAKAYFTQQELGFPVIRDQSGEIARTYGALKTPHAFIIDSKGKVIYKGGVTNSSNAKASTEFYLQTALKDIGEGKKPTQPIKKTLGCYIELSEVI